MFNQCFTSVSPVFHQCFTSVSPVFHQCFTIVSRVFQQCFIQCLTKVSKGFQKCIKSALRMIPKCLSVSVLFARIEVIAATRALGGLVFFDRKCCWTNFVLTNKISVQKVFGPTFFFGQNVSTKNLSINYFLKTICLTLLVTGCLTND